MSDEFFDDDTLDGGQGLADLFINCFLVILIVMFVFMLNQGVKAVTSRMDEQLLAELKASQEQVLKEAAANAEAVASQQREERDKKRAEKQAMLKKSRKAADTAEQTHQREIKQLQTELTKARSAKSLRIDISHDSTGSMADVFESTKGSVASITRTLPKLLRDVEIGFIAYQNMQLTNVPILPIRHADEDGGASIQNLNAMLSQMKSTGGTANIEQSIRTSMARMDAMPGSPRECLVVIGDADTNEVSPGDTSVADRLIADVKAWCEQSGKNRRVLALFTGIEGPGAAAFFQELGSVTPDSMYSTNNSQIFELIISAAFAPGELDNE